MAALTDSFENAILNTLRGTTLTSWTPYLALFTATPGETGGGTEVNGTSYARQAITLGAPSAGTSTTTADVVFPVAGSNWGTITHFGIFDAASGGTLKWYGALTASQAITQGSQLKFAAGQITLSID